MLGCSPEGEWQGKVRLETLGGYNALNRKLLGWHLTGQERKYEIDLIAQASPLS